MQVFHPVLKMKDLTSTDKLILCLLLSMGLDIKTNKNNEITSATPKFMYLSNNYIAEHIGVSVRTVKSAIKKLKDNNFIHVFYGTKKNITERKILIKRDRIVEMIYRQEESKEELLQDYAIKSQHTTSVEEPVISYSISDNEIPSTL